MYRSINEMKHKNPRRELRKLLWAMTQSNVILFCFFEPAHSKWAVRTNRLDEWTERAYANHKRFYTPVSCQPLHSFIARRR